MVNKNQRKMSIIEIHIQEDLPDSRNKETSMMKGSTEDNIMIIQNKNSQGLHHKQDHSLTCM
jgi:hypothetical protein